MDDGGSGIMDNDGSSVMDDGPEGVNNGKLDRIDEDSKVDNDSNNDDERFRWIKNDKDEEFYGIGLSDAYEDLHNKINPIQSLWPSEVYKEFMAAVTQHHLSDAAADSMLCIIQRYCTEEFFVNKFKF